MSTKFIVGQTYRVKPEWIEAWMMPYGVTPRDPLVKLIMKEDADDVHLYETHSGEHIYLASQRLQWFDEKSAMREVVPESVSGTNPSLLMVDEFEWSLPAGTFFRVANKHTPLYMVMSNSHVFNLTDKQMHTTDSLRFKGKQLVVANVSITEAL
ncbi:hypothetical protein [Providencia phage PSTRCR_120]|uniref:Uncharacterized protein n=1 Tax=Providencia phage PSTRCR_120 TaxID=2800826 RepID=A0A7T7CL37_9CAUD|nr:hypothetical protein [Providencia phage PSTRCR_120]